MRDSVLKNPLTRRRFVQASGVAVAGGSAAFISACGSNSGPSSPDAARDAALLNAGRALTLSLAAAYAETAPLLAGPVRAITARFRAQAVSQASGLATAIGKFGSPAVKPKTSAEYAQQLGISSLKDQPAALRFLVDLEKRTIGGYETGIQALGNTDLRGVFAQIVTCEAQHIAVLAGLLTSNNPAKQAPQAFVTGPGIAAAH